MKLFLPILIFAIFSFTNEGAIKSKISTPEKSQDAAFINYVWYYDEWMIDPVGTTSTIATELNRLRLLYPGYTFSSLPAVGLYPFEWGFYSPTISAVIYSNL